MKPAPDGASRGAGEIEVEAVPSPELFFAFVGPVGTDLRLAQATLEQELRTVAYEPVEVRMSHLLRDVTDFSSALEEAEKGPEDKRIESYMDCGDELRRRARTGAVLAYLGAVYVRQFRKEHDCAANARARAFIFNSLKHPEEVKALRRIYGEALVAISIYSPRDVRKQALIRRIAKSRHAYSSDEDHELAEKLIARDSKGSDVAYGQNVADTFPLADFFVRDDAREGLERDLQRLVEILFQHPYRTPTKDEFGMFQARGSALRSADLSRQVGAAICDSDGSLVASGCNEVPKPGGGTYWEGDDPDYRDFRYGSDANALAKRHLLAEVLRELCDAKWFKAGIQRLGTAELLNKATSGADGILRQTRASSLLEFGRVVHAEMNALMDAARRGVAVRGMTLYCTTFPCHICARHILAAGIRRVVYVEPYPKSLATDLYPNALRVDEQAADADALDFDAFVGVAPRRFMPCFHAPRRRKDDLGYSVVWTPAVARPRFQTVREAHLDLETFVAAKLEKFARQLRLI